MLGKPRSLIVQRPHIDVHETVPPAFNAQAHLLAARTGHLHVGFHKTLHRHAINFDNPVAFFQRGRRAVIDQGSPWPRACRARSGRCGAGPAPPQTGNRW